MTYVLEKDRDLDDVRKLTARGLDRESDVVPHPLRLFPRITDADYFVVLVKCNLPSYVNHVAAANDV